MYMFKRVGEIDNNSFSYLCHLEFLSQRRLFNRLSPPAYTLSPLRPGDSRQNTGEGIRRETVIWRTKSRQIFPRLAGRRLAAKSATHPRATAKEITAAQLPCQGKQTSKQNGDKK